MTRIETFLPLVHTEEVAGRAHMVIDRAVPGQVESGEIVQLCHQNPAARGGQAGLWLCQGIALGVQELEVGELAEFGGQHRQLVV
jgi:hypothetical protein